MRTMIARPIMAVTPLLPSLRNMPGTVRAGIFEDEEKRDNDKGFERDETDNRLRPVALVLGTPSQPTPPPPLPRRTPGETIPPLVRRNARAGAEDACGVCGWWRCRCGEQSHIAVHDGVGPAITASGDSGGWQCNQCGNWFTGPASQTCPSCS